MGIAPKPIIAVVVQPHGNDLAHSIYCVAYGFEMQFDDETPLRLVLLAPHQFLHAITQSTDILSFANVEAGSSTIPMDQQSEPCYSDDVPKKANWVLFDRDMHCDDWGDPITGAQFALTAGRRCFLRLTLRTQHHGPNDGILMQLLGHLREQLRDVKADAFANLAIVIGPNDPSDSFSPDQFQLIQSSARLILRDVIGIDAALAEDVPILYGGDVPLQEVAEYISKCQDGLLLTISGGNFGDALRTCKIVAHERGMRLH